MNQNNRKSLSEYDTGYDTGIRYYKKLNDAESYDLIVKLRNGDNSVRDELIVGNLALVFNVAKVHKNRGVELSDLISIGTIGLINAIDNYNINKKTSFASYAYHTINNTVINGLYEESRLIKIPHYQIAKYMSFNKEERDNLSPERLASIFKMDKKLGDYLYYLVQDPINFGVNINSLDSNEKAIDLISDTSANSAEDEYIDQNKAEELYRAIEEANLSDMEKEILSLRFGSSEKNPISFEEMGKRYNISREYVRVILIKSLEKISRSKIIDTFAETKEEKENLAKVRTKKYINKK